MSSEQLGDDAQFHGEPIARYAWGTDDTLAMRVTREGLKNLNEGYPEGASLRKIITDKFDGFRKDSILIEFNTPTP